MDFIMKSDRDGLVLEWSKNGGVNWAPLGGINSGSNWFNASVVVGNSIIGWAGNSRDLADNLIDRDTLVQVRRALDNIGPLSQTDRQNVRFRMAFKSNLDVEDEGFGFNNLRIESRNRISLVENFTNESDPGFDANDTGFKTFDPIETATLQYHLGYPGNDDNYPVNTADPSARAAFYGIPLTDQYLPRGYVDGASGGGGNFSNLGWATTRLAKQGLKTSPYKLTAITLASTDLSYLKVSVTVDAEVGIPGNERPILHIAAVEKTVNTIKNNEFVVRKLIPSAIGTMLSTPMAQGATITIVDSVRLENPLIDVTDLALIAFVQDENTREVYQAILNLTPGPLPDPGSITGIENPAYADKINLFPNPANHAVTIQLPAAVTKNTPVAMFDTYGRTVYQNTLGVGEQTKSINTTNMTGGVYIIQIGTPDGGVARRKVMVVHQ